MSSGSAARVGRGTAVNWIAWILARALALGTLVLLTRTLAADELGALLAALAAGVLGAAIAAGGLPDATARQAAAAETPRPGSARRPEARNSPLRGRAAVRACGGDRDHRPTSSDFSLSQVLAAVTLAVTQGITTIMAGVFRARGQPGRFALATNLGSSAGRALIAGLAYPLSWEGGVVLWAFAAMNLIVALVPTCTRRCAACPTPAGRRPGEGDLQLGGVLWSLLGNADVVTVGLVLGAGAGGHLLGLTARGRVQRSVRDRDQPLLHAQGGPIGRGRVPGRAGRPLPSRVPLVGDHDAGGRRDLLHRRAGDRRADLSRPSRYGRDAAADPAGRLRGPGTLGSVTRRSWRSAPTATSARRR